HDLTKPTKKRVNQEVPLALDGHRPRNPRWPPQFTRHKPNNSHGVMARSPFCSERVPPNHFYATPIDPSVDSWKRPPEKNKAGSILLAKRRRPIIIQSSF
ncbi:MAG: hypothetical protein WD875_18805, partial [Pirellulales bacterium]